MNKSIEQHLLEHDERLNKIEAAIAPKTENGPRGIIFGGSYPEERLIELIEKIRAHHKEYPDHRFDVITHPWGLELLDKENRRELLKSMNCTIIPRWPDDPASWVTTYWRAIVRR